MRLDQDLKMEPEITGLLDENNTLTNTSLPTPRDDPLPLSTIIGLLLAFGSCFFIGLSVILKKLALIDLEKHGGTRAVDGGFGYLRFPKWWFGISLMAAGELTNFTAYIFAPAILVTPLGVFSIVFTATLSPYFLNEKLNTVGKLGCTLVLVGCVIVTLCGPKDREVSTMAELESQLLNIGFLTYASLVVMVSFILMLLVPRYGHKYVLLYITICSSYGSLSVMFCKGVGLALKETVSGKNQFNQLATWICLICLIACLLIETAYMQRALDIFNSSLFMSVNYVMFTSLVIIASSILYTELKVIGWKNIVLTILGFVVNIVALYLLHIDKDVSFEEIPKKIFSPCRKMKESGKEVLNEPENKSLLKSETGENVCGRNSKGFDSKSTNNNEEKYLAYLQSSALSDIQTHNDGSISSVSSFSQNSSLTKPDNNRDNGVTFAQGIIEPTSTSYATCMCEVPLITELQSCSRGPSSPAIYNDSEIVRACGCQHTNNIKNDKNITI